MICPTVRGDNPRAMSTCTGDNASGLSSCTGGQTMVLLLLVHCTVDKIHVVQSKKEGKEQESIQSSTTPDLGYQWKVTTSPLDLHVW